MTNAIQQCSTTVACKSPCTIMWPSHVASTIVMCCYPTIISHGTPNKATIGGRFLSLSLSTDSHLHHSCHRRSRLTRIGLLPCYATTRSNTIVCAVLHVAKSYHHKQQRCHIRQLSSTVATIACSNIVATTIDYSSRPSNLWPLINKGRHSRQCCR